MKVIIIGAGIVGICTALSLQEKGIETQLIDRDLPGQGASHGNAGIISPWSIIPQSTPHLWKKIPSWILNANGPASVKLGYIPQLLPWAVEFLKQGKLERVIAHSNAMEILNKNCIDLYRQHLQETTHQNLIKDCYYVHAYRNEQQADLSKLEYQIRIKKGAELTRIGSTELKHLEPALSTDFKAAILIKGQARATSPGKIGFALSEKFKRLGGNILKENVVSLRPDGHSSWLVTTNDQQIVADKVIVAAGAWSTKLLKPLGIHIKMEAERGYHVNFPNPEVSLTHSIMDMDMMSVASSMGEGLRLAGTAEFAGLNAPENSKRSELLIKSAKKMLPDLNINQPSSWMGIRPSLPDSLPCIGYIKGFNGLLAAFGHSHYGLMMAPKTGQIIADLATNTVLDVDVSAFKVDRF